MKTTLEKITPEPQPVKKLPFPKLVIDRKLGVIVLMLKPKCGVCIKSPHPDGASFDYHSFWNDDSEWQDLAPNECVKLKN